MGARTGIAWPPGSIMATPGAQPCHTGQTNIAFTRVNRASRLVVRTPSSVNEKGWGESCADAPVRRAHEDTENAHYFAPKATSMTESPCCH